MSKDTYIITRKFTIIPTHSERKEWEKKIYKYTIENLEKKIEEYKTWIENAKKNKKLNKEEKEKKIEKYKNLLCQTEESLAYVIENKEFTNKMVSDYTKSLVKDAMESEARRKNYILSWAFATMIENGVQYMDFLEQMKFITEMMKPAYRKKGSNKGSVFDDVEIENILGGYGVGFSQELTGKIKDAVKAGLLNGKVSLPTYKLDSPFTINKADIGFSHDFDSYEKLCEHINEGKNQIYFNYGGNGKPTIAKFCIEIRNNKNKEELKATLLKLLSGEYQYCGSSIQMAKKDAKIILNLAMEIPKCERELDENTVVGVDLGQAIPATCALNNDIYERAYIGNADDFVRVRTKIQNQRRQLSKSLRNSNGGHGRKKKLKPLDRFEQYEKHFVQSYNHMVSKRVVDFALKHNAKYINLESLKGYDADQKVLRNWSYYQLQNYIVYKAEKYGIIVRKVNPCYTSQVCSYCGHWEDGQRDKREFICKNKKCKSHELKKNVHADFNAARNIAMSTLWFDGEVTEKQKEEAREYYGIK